MTPNQSNFDKLLDESAIVLFLALEDQQLTEERLENMLLRAREMDEQNYIAPRLRTTRKYLAALAQEGLPFAPIPTEKRDGIYHWPNEHIERLASLCDPARLFADSWVYVQMAKNNPDDLRHHSGDTLATIFYRTAFAEAEKPSHDDYRGLFDFPPDIFVLARDVRKYADAGVKQGYFRNMAPQSSEKEAHSKRVELHQKANIFYARVAEHVFQHFDEMEYFMGILKKNEDEK